MRPFALLTCLCLVAGTTTAPAQPMEDRRWFVTYGYGRSEFDLQQIRDFLWEFVEEYRDIGVPLTRQLNFPPNHLHSLEVTRSEGLLRLGVGAAASNSMAFAGYRDGAGSVRLRIKASMVLLYAHAGIRNIRLGEWGMSYLSLKAGKLIGKIESEEELVLYDYPEISGKRTKDARILPTSLTAVAGIDMFPYDRIVVGVEAGYRFAKSEGARVWDEKFIKQAEFEGFVVTAVVGVVL